VQQQIPAVEDTYIAPRFGLFEFIRKVREDQLSLLTPDIFDRRLYSFRLFRARYFVVNWPDYIEHVLLTNNQNYVKGRFSDVMLGPIVDEGMLTSEGEAWRRRRRIAAPAFHHRSIARFVDEMAHSTRSMLARWEGRNEPFDIASEMTELTLDVNHQDHVLHRHERRCRQTEAIDADSPAARPAKHGRHAGPAALAAAGRGDNHATSDRGA
jgi:cytochrome P450